MKLLTILLASTKHRHPKPSVPHASWLGCAIDIQFRLSSNQNCDYKHNTKPVHRLCCIVLSH